MLRRHHGIHIELQLHHSLLKDSHEGWQKVVASTHPCADQPCTTQLLFNLSEIGDAPDNSIKTTMHSYMPVSESLHFPESLNNTNYLSRT